MKNPIRAILLLACLKALNPLTAVETTPETPRLLFKAENGQTYPVSGQQYTAGKARPYYYDEKEEQTYITSIADISIDASPTSIDKFALLADSYIARRQSSRRQDKAQNPLVLIHLDFEDAIRHAWPKEDYTDHVFTIIWIQDDKITPLYVSRFTSHLNALGLPNTINSTPEKGYEGYPALIVFKNGEALRPGKNALTRQSLADYKDQDRTLEAAALNDFPAHLSTHLPPKTEKNANLYTTLIRLALRNGRTAAVEVLIKNTLEAPKNNLRQIPEFEIRIALQQGHLETLLALLNHPGLEIGQKKSASKLVEQSIIDGRFEFANALLKTGYPLNISKAKRPEALRSCLSHNRIDYVEKLYPRGRPKPSDFQAPQATSIYHQIAATATPATLEYLKQFDIPIDLEDPDQITPLIKAAGYGNIAAVCWLLDNGARIDHRNADGHTALQYSIVTQQAEATACLLQQGSDINMLGPEGVTPLMQAALFRDIDAATAIAQAGGIWNLDSTFLDHCLTYTIQQDLAPILQTAIQQGLSPNYKAYHKWPLDWLALYYGSSACRELLAPSSQSELQPSTTPPPEIHLKNFDRRLLNKVLDHDNLPDTVSFTCLLTPHSNPTLIWLRTPVERFLENDLRTLINDFEFQLSAPQPSEDGTLLMLTAELNFKGRPTNLNDALSIQSLTPIAAPE